MHDGPLNNRLSDGREIRALAGAFTQEQMFGLHWSGCFDPAKEAIMSVKELDDAINISESWQAIDVNGLWRTSRFAAYRRGFEKENLPIGDNLVWIENGIAYKLAIPDVPVVIAKPGAKYEITGLRQATGMLDFDLTKLGYNPETRLVSVASDFNPETDVRVIDIMRPRAFALTDANGYPLRSQPKDGDLAEAARYSDVRNSDEFEGKSTGYHGSVTRFFGMYLGAYRFVTASDCWARASGVAVVTRVS